MSWRDWAIRLPGQPISTPALATPTRSSWCPTTTARSPSPRPPIRARKVPHWRGEAVLYTPARPVAPRSRPVRLAIPLVVAQPYRGAVSSNVGQNYPYSSETEADREAVVARLTAQFAD